MPRPPIPPFVAVLILALSSAVHAQQSNTSEQASPADRFVSESTGDAIFTIPIPTPRGTGGFQPQLALRYSSGSGDGPFGVGWQLPLGEIRRSTRFGIPSYNDSVDRFELDGELLVAHPTNTGEYRLATEAFARITHDTGDESWTVEYPNGLKGRYGTTPESQIRRGGSTNPASDAGPVFRWLPAELQDANGNAVRFEYDRSLDVGTAYPGEIIYTYRNGLLVGGIARSITFVLEPRPDAQHLFTGAVETWVRHRVVEIQSTVGGSPFRRLVLGYSGATDYSTNRTRLVSAQLFGDDCSPSEPDPETACDGMPEQEFTYGDPAAGLPPDPASNWTAIPFTAPRNIVTGTNQYRGADAGARFGDVNGDGRVDFVVAKMNGWEVFLGNESGGFTLSTWWTARLKDVDFTPYEMRYGEDGCSIWVSADLESGLEAVPFVASFSPNEVIGDPNSYGSRRLNTPIQSDLVDVNGDGLADIVMSIEKGAAYLQGQTQVGNPPTWTGNGCPEQETIIQGGAAMKHVWLNTGAGWERNDLMSSTLPTMWSNFLVTHDPWGEDRVRTKLPNLIIEEQAADLEAGLQTFLYFDDHGARYADLNGDGRLDLLIARSAAHMRSFGSSAWLNLATGWVQAPQFTPPLPFVAEYIFSDVGHAISHFTGEDTGLRAIDLNGDGLSDLIKTAHEGSTYAQNEVFAAAGVWLNTGDGWCTASTGCPDAARYAPPEGESFTYASIEPDYMGTPNPSLYYGEPEQGEAVTPSQVSYVDLNADGRPDMLRSDGTAPGGLRAWIHQPSHASNVWVEDPRFAPLPSMATATRYQGSGFDHTADTGVRFIDLDLKGGIDFIRSDQDAGDSAFVATVRLSDRVGSHDNGSGAIVEVTYAKAAGINDAALTAAAKQDATDLGEQVPVVTWSDKPVVAELTVSGIDVFTATYFYAYAEPRWCPVWRSSLGFRAFQSSNDQDESVSRMFFWQRHGLAGRRSRVEIFEAGTLLRKATSIWELLDGGSVIGSVPGAHVGRAIAETTQTFSGGVPGALHSVELDYDDSYGFNFINSVITNRPTGALHVSRVPELPADTTNWVIGLVAEETQTGSGGIVYSRERYDYVPGKPLLTRIERDIQLRASGAPVEGVSSTDRVFDAFGNLRAVSEAHTASSSHTRYFCYDGDMDLGSVACPTSSSATHTVPAAVLDPIGGVSSFDVDLATGDVLSIDRFNGDLAWIIPDAFGRVKEQWVQPASHAQPTLLESSNYFDGTANPAGRPFVERLQAVGDGTFVRDAEYFDGLARKARSVYVTPQGYAGRFVVRDHRGRAIAASQDVACGSNPHCEVVPPPTNFTTIVYDAVDRPLLVDSPSSGIAVNAYGAATRAAPVGPSGAQGYDVVLSKDGNGNLTQTILDGSRVVWVEECEASVAAGATSLETASCGSNSTNAETFYTYDPTGEVSVIFDATRQYADPEHRLEYLHDTVANIREIRDPNGGTTATTYYLDGEVASVANARGQQTAYTYDGLGRMVSIDAPPGENDTVISYDPHTRQRASATIGSGAIRTQHFYDAFGREERKITSLLTTSLVMDFAYDLLGRTTQVIYPDSTTIHYVYQGAYLHSVCEANNTCSSPSTTWISDVLYDGLGRELEIAQPHGRLTFDYDAASHRLERVAFEETASGQFWLDLTLGFDPLGNVETITDAHSGPEPPGEISATAVHTYDRRNRIASWQWGGSTKHFGYDALGNLSHKAVASPADPPNLTYGDASRPHAVTHHSTSGKDFEYDADGNLTRRGGQHLKYDSANRLVCVGTSAGACDIAQYGYDTDGALVAEIGVNTRIHFENLFVLDQSTAISTILGLGRSLGERHRSNAILRTAWLPPGWEPPVDPWLVAWIAATAGGALLLLLAVRGGVIGALVRRPIPVSIAVLLGASLVVPAEAIAGGGGPAPVKRWTYQDHLGNQVLYVNDTPALIYRRVFEPFGGVAAESLGTAAHERIFTGKREDPDTRVGSESGIINFGARWYDAEIGRFLAIDPIVQDVGDPQTHNPYSYARNNPTTFTDPDGQGWVDILGIVLGAVVLVAALVTQNYWAIPSSVNMIGLGVGGLGYETAGLALSLTALTLGVAYSAYSSPTFGGQTVIVNASEGTAAGGGNSGILDSLALFGVSGGTQIQDLDSSSNESSRRGRGGQESQGNARSSETARDPNYVWDFGWIKILGSDPSAERQAHEGWWDALWILPLSRLGRLFGIGGRAATATTAAGRTITLEGHVLTRAAERGISTGEIQATIRKGAEFLYRHEGLVKTGYYDPASKIFVGEIGGRAATVFRTGMKYIENLMKTYP